jgi:sugar/nucleoside kinase (ribokinase family)
LIVSADAQPDRDLDLLVAGEINPDIVVTDPDPRPVFGQTERLVRSIRLSIGSSSVITACGAARLGLRVAAVGIVGDDELGRFMLEAMRDRGLETTACRIAPGRATGASVILGNGQDRAILTATGAIGDLRAEDIPDELLRRTRHLHVGSYYLQPALAAAIPDLFRRAHALGVTTSLDPNWDPSERWDGFIEALAETDLAFPNAGEACRIARTEDVNAAALAMAATAAGDGRAAVVVKLGADGAIAATPDGRLLRGAAPIIEPVDTTGAGDTFNAGFLAAWLEGRDLVDALRFAVACGSLSTLSVGGTDGQPTRAEADAAVRRGTA